MQISDFKFLIRYKIADCVIRLESPFRMPDSVNAEAFYTCDERADYTVFFEQIDSFYELIDRENYEVLSSELGGSVMKCRGKEFRNFTRSGGSYAMTVMGPDRAVCYFEDPRIFFRFMEENAKPLSFCCLERIMLKFGRVILHSSYINYIGDGIVISAPSGTGKSTHADLWAECYGATVVNGDRSIIGREVKESASKSSYYVYGLPMCGSSGIFKNITSPLRAIAVIRQAKVNKVRKIGGMEAFRYVFSEVTQNSWNDSYMNRLMDLVEELVSSVPVYLLECNMEREAAECLHEAIYGEK